MTKPDPVLPEVPLRTAIDTTVGSTAAAIPATLSGSRARSPAGTPPRLAFESVSCWSERSARYHPAAPPTTPASRVSARAPATIRPVRDLAFGGRPRVSVCGTPYGSYGW